MLWTEIKKWAKEQGYETIKDKDGEITSYYWAKLDDPQASGVSKSVSKLAWDIYNHITENKWIEFQKEFKQKQEESSEHIDMTNYATG
jgi:phosphoribosylformylglycinamidine (FGAM) synthase PurS component